VVDDAATRTEPEPIPLVPGPGGAA
jgi:hypothetical protein